MQMRASGEFKPAAIRYDFRPGVMAPKERVALLRRLYGNGTGGANPNGRPQTSGGNRPQSPTKRKAESVVASYITGPRRWVVVVVEILHRRPPAWLWVL